LVSRGFFEGRSNEVIAIAVIMIIGVSGLAGAIIGGLFRGPGTEPPYYPEQNPLEITFDPRPFTTYEDYGFNLTLDAPQYELEENLTNVMNMWQFEGIYHLPPIRQSVRDAIADHYFAAEPSGFDLFSDVYRMNYDYEIPSFVTSDSILHAFHVLYDVALRRIEEQKFLNHVGNLSRHLVDVSLTQYTRLTDVRWKEAALRNMAYFAVAAKLHNSSWQVPVIVQQWVENVMTLIDDAQGFDKDWFMDQRLDFSQFIPRGHYTRSECLERYFRTMMWFGRVPFRLEPDDSWETNEQDIEKGRNESAQAILMCLALEQPSLLIADTTEPLRLWNELYDTTSFFVGTSDDLTPHEYLEIIDYVYENPLNYVEIYDEDKLTLFIATAMECRSPMIVSGFVADTQSINVTKGMRLMGQRFVPDSYMFSELTHVQVENRLMPKALDIMALLGSNRAWELLEDDRQTYENYSVQVNFLNNTFGNLSKGDWTKNLYWLWLYSVKNLLHKPKGGYPSFMLTDQWVDKQLTTCLGTWTELRHDTILYAKQSYTMWYGATLPPPGYVEPVPEFFARMASLCRMLQRGLTSRNLLDDEIALKLQFFLDLILDLQTIAEKQLSRTTITEEEWDLLRYIGRSLSSIEGIDGEGGRAALVADVHTDTITSTVLEEATGNPMIIYVAVPNEEGEPFLARGAMYSHYEFVMPMSERLSDEDWWDIMDEGEMPDMASWMNSFVVGWSGYPVVAENSHLEAFNQKVQGSSLSSFLLTIVIQVLGPMFRKYKTHKTSLE
jgi:hypothetical protein